MGYERAQGFDESKAAAKTGGRIAGDARRQLEQESGKPVISKENFFGILTPVSIETKAIGHEDR